jgi:hypothetical protein
VPAAEWKRLGELLVRQRIELDPRYSNRQLFASERGLNYRTVSDIERGRRDNYEDATITAVEVAYHVAPGSVAAVTGKGGDLDPLPAPRTALHPVRASAPGVTAQPPAEEILAGLLSRYKDDGVIQAMGAQVPLPPAWAAVQEILWWLERQGDEAAAAEVLGSLLSRYPGDEVIQQIGRQYEKGGKQASMVTAEILEFMSWRPPRIEAGNGTTG